MARSDGPLDIHPQIEPHVLDNRESLPTRSTDATGQRMRLLRPPHSRRPKRPPGDARSEPVRPAPSSTPHRVASFASHGMHRLGVYTVRPPLSKGVRTSLV